MADESKQQDVEQDEAAKQQATSLSESEKAITEEHQKPDKGGNVMPGLVWCIIGLALIKFVGYDGLTTADEHATWQQHTATVFTQEVGHDPDSGGWQLHIEFIVDFGDEKKKYRTMRHTGDNKPLKRYAETTYATGAKIDVLINPDNRNQFAFPKVHSYGPFLVGFIPGGICMLIGLSILFRKK